MKLERLKIEKFQKNQISDLNSIRAGKKEVIGLGKFGNGDTYTCYSGDVKTFHWWTKKVKMVLLKNLCVIVFLMICEQGFGQSNYLSYYRDIAKAKDYRKVKNIDSCVYYYKKAFEKVDYVHIDIAKNARSNAKKVRDKKFISVCDSIIRAYKLINKNKVAIQIDSIYKEDQRVRGSKYMSAKKYLQKCYHDDPNLKEGKEYDKAKQLFGEWQHVDSLNIKLLKEIINEVGFPMKSLLVNKQLVTLHLFCFIMIMIH
nr:hypothetical protein [uncultured Carboxylicivirga sp.]